MIAVIPCAGHGTRMGALTQSVPKELLPFGDRVVLDLVVDELIAAGHRDIIVIIRQGKESIREHLLHHYPTARFEFVFQRETLGLGHAYLQVKDIVREPFLSALPDHIVHGEVAGPMWKIHRELCRTEGPCFILKTDVTVAPEEAGFSTGKRPDETGDPCLRNTGRIIYPLEFLECIDENARDGYTGELNERVPEKRFTEQHRIHSCRLAAEVWDVGTLPGYLYYRGQYSIRTGERARETIPAMRKEAV